jgi:hypothetical protein
MWPAEAPPGAGSTTALAVLLVHRPADSTGAVEEPDVAGVVVDPRVAADVEVLGAGTGAGGELLHAPRAVAAPAAASTAHTERTKRCPCVLTPPR